MNLPREFEVESANINIKWIENIFDNIKKIEEFERLAREGCASILEYIQLPIKDREIYLVEIQYKNLKLLLNEFILIVPDIVLIVGEEKSKEFLGSVKRIGNVINKKENIVHTSRSDVSNTITSAKLTPLFDKSLNILSQLRMELIIELKNILFMEQSRGGQSGRR